MKKILFALLLIPFNCFSQKTDTVTLKLNIYEFETMYKVVMNSKEAFNEVFPIVLKMQQQWMILSKKQDTIKSNKNDRKSN